MKRPRRELSIDAAVHRVSFKNNQCMLFDCFTFIPVTGITSISPIKNRSDTNACFKNRSNESVHLNKRSTAILIDCNWSFFEMYSLVWMILETSAFTWSVFHWRDRLFAASMCRYSGISLSYEWIFSSLGNRLFYLYCWFMRLFSWLLIVCIRCGSNAWLDLQNRLTEVNMQASDFQVHVWRCIKVIFGWVGQKTSKGGIQAWITISTQNYWVNERNVNERAFYAFYQKLHVLRKKIFNFSKLFIYFYFFKILVSLCLYNSKKCYF